MYINNPCLFFEVLRSTNRRNIDIPSIDIPSIDILSIDIASIDIASIERTNTHVSAIYVPEFQERDS